MTLATTLAAFAATAALTTATAFAAGLAGIRLHPQESLDLMLGLRGAALAKAVAVVTVACPVAEELIFRLLAFRGVLALAGLARPGASRSRAAVCAAAVASSAAFSAAHYMQARFPDNAFVALFAFGLLQCRLLSSAGAVWWPMLSHALFNALNIALLFAFPELAT